MVMGQDCFLIKHLRWAGPCCSLLSWRVVKMTCDDEVWPADPVTKQWLDSHMDPVFGFPSLVRFSWQTADRLLQDRAATVKW